MTEYRSQMDRWHDEPAEFARDLFTFYAAGLTMSEVQRRVSIRFGDRHRREDCVAAIERQIVAGVLEHVRVDRSSVIRRVTVGGDA
ncbi:hypothetical protein ACIBED_00920 [Rhodococcus coprophilus]|uniref:hypothetical protein n=1 Tax=Rhodococcus coprophilus TaxID=38310 RepID=UPI0037AFB463